MLKFKKITLINDYELRPHYAVESQIVQRTAKVTGTGEILKKMEELPTAIVKCWCEVQIRIGRSWAD